MNERHELAFAERAVAQLILEFPDRSVTQIATAVVDACDVARSHTKHFDIPTAERSARNRLALPGGM